MKIIIGDRVKGRTIHTGHLVVGTLENYDPIENVMCVKTTNGTHLCRPDTLELLQESKDLCGDPGAVRHLQMCPAHLLMYLMPETVPF